MASCQYFSARGSRSELKNYEHKVPQRNEINLYFSNQSRVKSYNNCVDLKIGLSYTSVSFSAERPLVFSFINFAKKIPLFYSIFPLPLANY